MKSKLKRWAVYGLLASLLAAPITVCASDAEQVPLENIQPPSEEESEPVPESLPPADAVQVVLPTDNSRIFDFILDPERLISQTGAAAYDNQRFEKDATLFFQRTDDTEVDYSSTSDAVTMINKGPVPVEITVTAKIDASSLGDIRLTDDREFTDDTDMSIFLALTDGEHMIPIDEEEGAVLRITASADAETEQKEDHIYHFRLTGAANSNGNWKKLSEGAPRVTVSWTLSAGRRTETEDNSEEEEKEQEVPPQDTDQDDENQGDEVQDDEGTVSANKPGDIFVSADIPLPDETEEDTLKGRQGENE